VPTITDNAVCLRHWDYSETSQTVSLFTREHGVIRGLAKGAKREKGRFSGGIDILTRGQAVAIIKPGRDLATITDWDLQEIYWPLRERAAAHRAGVYFADLVHRMVTGHDPHPALFDALRRALEDLGDPALDAWTVLRFQWALLNEAGYRPELDVSARTGKSIDEDAAGGAMAFSPEAGGLVDDTGGHSRGRGRWRVRHETVHLLRRLSEGSLERTENDRPAAERANRLLAAYLRHLIGEAPPTMRWMFPDLKAIPR